MKPELKPCPFCGADVELKSCFDSASLGRHHYTFVGCRNTLCEVSAHVKFYHEKRDKSGSARAVEIWNKRI